MARMLCNGCFECNKVTDKGVDCSAAGAVVTPIFRHEVEDGRYENCMWRDRRASSDELKLINLVIRVLENWGEKGRRNRPSKLTSAEIAEVEAQVRKRNLNELVLSSRSSMAA